MSGHLSAIIDLECWCGAPGKAHMMEISPGVSAFAINCSKRCGRDTHWQMSLQAASEIWRLNTCRSQSGGNGSAADDVWGRA